MNWDKNREIEVYNTIQFQKIIHFKSKNFQNFQFAIIYSSKIQIHFDLYAIFQHE